MLTTNILSWEIKIDPYSLLLILYLTCTYCPSPPGKGVSRHIVSVGELAFQRLRYSNI